MEWWLVLLIFTIGLMFFMIAGVPVAFSFLIVNFVMITILFGVSNGSTQIISSMYDSLIKFSLTSIPLFILMGELLYRSGIVGEILNAVSMWIGKVPGRLSLLSVSGGALFAALSGSSIANTAVLGSMLVPEMQKYKYSKIMSFGPIMAGAGLAIVIPPSTIAILYGSIGKVSVAPLLIGGIIPGICMALFYVGYILIRCSIKPALAPKYESDTFSTSEKLIALGKNLVPVLFILFLVLGLMFLGVATPTESAALGTMGALILVAVYRKLNKEVIIQAINGTLKVTGMIMFIVAGAAGFSQLLPLTGATRELLNVVTGFEVGPKTMVVFLLILVFIMGMFLEQIPIMMITLPVFIPIIMGLQIDPVWFGILMLVTMHIGTYSPPFGLVLFVMKGVAPPNISMLDLYKSAIPFIALDIAVILLMFFIPEMTTYLPNIMG